MSHVTLNKEIVWARYELGEDFFEEYIQYFKAHADETQLALDRAFAGAEMEKIAACAHDLKGLCFNLGLEKFAAHLASIEKLSAAGVSDRLQLGIKEVASLSDEGICALEAYRDEQKG